MCLHLLCTITISAFFMRPFCFRQSTTNQYQSIPIYLSIGIDNRYQSITTRIFAIDWSSIININRLIDIDWYRLISIVIDYRIHRLDTPGVISWNVPLFEVWSEDKLNKKFIVAENFAELVSTVALTCLEGGGFDPL